MTKRVFFPFVFLLVASLAAFWVACEIGVNPLLFDGTPLSAKYTVATTGLSYSKDTTITTGDLSASIGKSIDSIAVFNVTLLIDNFLNGTSPSWTVSGSATIFDGGTPYPLMTLTSVPFSTFSAERSIFDATLASLPNSGSVRYDTSGVGFLNRILKNPASLPPTLTVHVEGTASNSQLYFDITIKLYTQVFTH